MIYTHNMHNMHNSAENLRVINSVEARFNRAERFGAVV